jgi:hypothetical protein
LQFSQVQFPIATFSGGLANFNGPDLRVDQYAVPKKYFLINNNNIKGFQSHYRVSRLKMAMHGGSTGTKFWTSGKKSKIKILQKYLFNLIDY